MNDDAVQAMLTECVGDDPVCIYDILVGVYGEERVRRAFITPGNDPDLVEFMMRVDKRVDRAWKTKGITRELGPYVN